MPALCAVFFATGCEEPPPDDPPSDRLFVAVGDAEVTINNETTITVTSLEDGAAGEGSVTVTVDDSDDEGAGEGVVTVDQGTFSEVATTDLNDAGTATFTFRCIDVGTVNLSVVGPTGDGKATIECVAAQVVRFIAVDKTNCDQFLQADGASDCTVNVTVRNNINQLDTSAILAVDVVSVVSPTGGGVDQNVLKVDDADAPSNRIANITADANPYTFIVASPSRDTVQTMTLAITDDGGNKVEIVVDIVPFADRSSVEIEADEQNITEGRETQVTITAKDASGAAAAGQLVTMTSTANLIPEVGGCLAAAGDDFEATMDDAGTCTFAVAADDEVDPANNIGTLRVEFQADQINRIDTINLTIAQQGQVVANVTAAPLEIFADQEPSTSTIVANVQIDGAGLEDATVRAEVANNSRGVIRLTTVAVGADNPAAITADAAEANTDGAGLISFTVVADNALSRGRGTITVTILLEDGTEVARQLVDISVDREPVLSTLVFEDFDPDSVIGVPGGPLPSSTGLSFRLLDEENQPVPNVPVTFTAQSSVPGVSVVPFALSDATGFVQTVVTAGRVAGPLTVIAVTDNGLSAASPPISVVGGLPNSAFSAVNCDTVAARAPFQTACSATLADKFTNVVETELNVQFRAEGGNITSTASSAGGIASGTFSTGEPGPGSADVRAWSYSPIRTAPDAVRQAFPGCFDRTTRSPCNLLELCQTDDPTFRAFCPLPPNIAGTASCTADISELSTDALLDEAADPGEWELALFFPELSAIGDVVTAQFAAYSVEHRACGIPLSCLVGDANGLGVDDSDDCPVNAGCLDFSAETECPQNGLLDVLAAVRGEEGFDDRNGNGVRDVGEAFTDTNGNGFRDAGEPFVDANGNGAHDPAEDFVDFPEPFLDKNSSCSYDNLNENRGLTAGQKVTLSDLFIDSDPDDGLFGFVNNNVRTETNGVFDSDTEIFLKTTVVQLGSARLQVGTAAGAAVCGPDGRAVVDCEDVSGVSEGTSSCTETAGGEAILEGCLPVEEKFRIGTTAVLAFRWTDENGNCPTDDFAGSPSIEVDGPLTIAFNDGPYSQAECGSSPGARNPERPWCADQAGLAARTREVVLTPDCAQDDVGEKTATLTFELDGQVASVTIPVGCPACGDRIIEPLAGEACDDGNRANGDGCDAACTNEEGFTCIDNPDPDVGGSLCTPN
jgi:cysteine-rich repeat protein